jgi:hypothetical protein
MFQRNLLLPSSWTKSKQEKQRRSKHATLLIYSAYSLNMKTVAVNSSEIWVKFDGVIP